MSGGKTHIKTILVLGVLMALSSCSTKPCRCYLLERWGSVRINTVYIDDDTPCSDLGYNHVNPDDSSFRLCTDMEDSLIDYADIVRMFWGSIPTQDE